MGCDPEQKKQDDTLPNVTDAVLGHDMVVSQSFFDNIRLGGERGLSLDVWVRKFEVRTNERELLEVLASNWLPLVIKTPTPMWRLVPLTAFLWPKCRPLRAHRTLLASLSRLWRAIILEQSGSSTLCCSPSNIQKNSIKELSFRKQRISANLACHVFILLIMYKPNTGSG